MDVIVGRKGEENTGGFTLKHVTCDPVSTVAPLREYYGPLDMVVDIGACIGALTLYAAAAGAKKVLVLALVPLLFMLLRLEQRRLRQSNVLPHCIGVCVRTFKLTQC
jgi:hypothetical protein